MNKTQQRSAREKMDLEGKKENKFLLLLLPLLQIRKGVLASHTNQATPRTPRYLQNIQKASGRKVAIQNSSWTREVTDPKFARTLSHAKKAVFSIRKRRPPAGIRN